MPKNDDFQKDFDKAFPPDEPRVFQRWIYETLNELVRGASKTNRHIRYILFALVIVTGIAILGWFFP